MHRYLLAILCCTQFLCTSAFGTTNDLHAAEQVAQQFLHLSFAGNTRAAVQMIDADSLATTQTYTLGVIRNVIAAGRPDYLETLGIHGSVDELAQLSPTDFYLKVISAMTLPQKNLLASLKTATVTVSSSEMLADGRASVKMSITPAPTPQLKNMTLKLRLDNSKWKVLLGS
jgi:hypothetical protein